MNGPLDPIAARFSAAGATVERFTPPTPSYKFPFELAADISIDASPEWAIDDLLPLHGLAAIYGPPGCGKSFLAIDAAMHIATGREWFGREVQQGGVVYIAAEAGKGLRKRIVACRKALGITGAIPFAMISVAPNLGTTKTANDGKEVSDAARLIQEIERQAPQLGMPVRVVVIDTLARTMFGADENSASDMGAFIANAGRVADHFGCLALAVHHNGKNEAAGMRGSSALHGACDAEWEVKSLGDVKTVHLVKNKEGEDGLTWSFRLAVETVHEGGRNLPGKVSVSKPMTSCSVDPLGTPKHSETIKTRKAPTGHRKIALDAVRDALITHGTPLPASPDLPTGQGVKRSYIADNAYNRGFGDADKPDSRRAMFSKELARLSADGWVGIWGDWVWLQD